MTARDALRRSIVLAGVVTLLTPARADTTYYKFVKEVPAKAGTVIEPGWVRPRLADPKIGAGKPGIFRDNHRFVERLLESTRRQVAPELPARANSTFATPARSVAYWRRELPRTELVEVRPVDPRQVTVRDLAHLDRVNKLVLSAFWKPWRATGARAADSVPTAYRRDLLREAHEAAVDYWTKEPGKDARVEVLMGGGAVYVKPAPASLPGHE